MRRPNDTLLIVIVALLLTLATSVLAQAQCDRSQCGPQLGMPNYLCPDGKTVAGPSGRCLKGPNGNCYWEIITCPCDPKTKCPCKGNTECPNLYFCQKPNCTSLEGYCVPYHVNCSRGDPVCACNGKTYDSACSATAAQQSIAYAGPCRQRCIRDNDCANIPNSYCKKSSCSSRATGVCVQRPNCYDNITDPVCGCDKKTYNSDCAAAEAGVNIFHSGACDGSRCTDDECKDGSYCQKPSCSSTGTCQPMPHYCPNYYKPVCGCDGVTYPNYCYAAAAGVSVSYVGACVHPCNCGDLPPGIPIYCPDGSRPYQCVRNKCGCYWKIIGCPNPRTTATPTQTKTPYPYTPTATQTPQPSSTQAPTTVRCVTSSDCLPTTAALFCFRTPDPTTGISCNSNAGVCAPYNIPCDPSLYDPVCGCDGNTYSSPCLCQQNSQSIAYKGTCHAKRSLK